MALLPNNITLEAVTLNVRDLVMMKDFYSKFIGLDIIQTDKMKVTLGYNKNEILHLISRPDLDYPKFGSAGLYHTAFLFGSRSKLSKTLKNIFESIPDDFVGSSDHMVSEAFYLYDPEGNGIELYFDKDKSEWEWDGNTIVMGSNYINLESYIKDNVNESVGDESIRIGHIHLKVGNIDEAIKLYVDTIGFDVTALLPSALFISVDRYHHHLGMNIWESNGAGFRGESLGLNSFEIFLKDKKSLKDLQTRLESNSYVCEKVEKGFLLKDPWGNNIEFLI